MLIRNNHRNNPLNQLARHPHYEPCSGIMMTIRQNKVCSTTFKWDLFSDYVTIKSVSPMLTRMVNLIVAWNAAHRWICLVLRMRRLRQCGWVMKYLKQSVAPSLNRAAAPLAVACISGRCFKVQPPFFVQAGKHQTKKTKNRDQSSKFICSTNFACLN